MMERTISATEARVKFGELMQRVFENDEAVIVERDGNPRVVILSIDSYKQMKGEESPWERWEADLRRLHDHLKAELAGRPLSDSVEIIRQMRQERDEQLSSLR